jgi:hypothetical protein
MKRNLLLVAVAISAGVHAGLAPSHLREEPLLGIGFVAATLLLAVTAVGLARRSDSRRPTVAGAAVLAALIAGYAATRTVGLPGLERESWDSLGLATNAVEILGVAAAIHLIRNPRREIA